MSSNLANIIKETVGVEVFTPDNHLTPIFRYGQYDRLARPGYSWVTPYIENAGIPFKTSLRVTLAEFKDVMSKDNIPFNIKLTVLYRFNPSDSSRNVIAQFAIVPDEVLENIVKDYTSQGLRRLAACYRAEALTGQPAMSCIEEDLNTYLNAQMGVLGLQLLPKDSILIREALPPEKFRRTMLAVNLHQATIRVLANSNNPHLIKQALNAEFISGLEDLKGNMMLVPNMETMHSAHLLDQAEHMFTGKNGTNGTGVPN